MQYDTEGNPIVDYERVTEFEIRVIGYLENGTPIVDYIAVTPAEYYILDRLIV
jgi:hypothetical protein